MAGQYSEWWKQNAWSKEETCNFSQQVPKPDSSSDITSRLYIYVPLKYPNNYHILILHKRKKEA